MKKALLILVAALALATAASAQQKAIGIRTGFDPFSASLSGIEASFQYGLSDANRLEFDAGWSSLGHENATNLYVAGMYHWKWNIVDKLDWFVGPGIVLTMYDLGDNIPDYGGLGLGICGQVGVQYTFDFPLTVGLDTRPMLDVLHPAHGLYFGLCASARFVF